MVVLLGISSITYANAYSGKEIPASEARFYDGNRALVCGKLVQVTEFRRGLFLNLDNSYPKQSITFTLWRDDIAEFNRIHKSYDALMQKEICAEGVIKMYKNKPEILLSDAKDLIVKNK